MSKEYKDAMAALREQDIEELRSYRRPPALVVKVTDVLCLMFGQEPGWESSKQLLSREDFYQVSGSPSSASARATCPPLPAAEAKAAPAVPGTPGPCTQASLSGCTEPLHVPGHGLLTGPPGEEGPLQGLLWAPSPGWGWGTQRPLGPFPAGAAGSSPLDRLGASISSTPPHAPGSSAFL